MSFADNLKVIRKERGLSQEDLAELLDVSRQAVSKWEQGDGYPEMEKVLFLSRELKISLDDLMGEADYTPTPAAPPSGRIFIKSFDGKSLVNCMKVSSSRVSWGKTSPQFALFGADSTSFWGDNNTLLGWYATEEDARQEVEAINDALLTGKPSYSLKYAAKVKNGRFSVKLEEQ